MYSTHPSKTSIPKWLFLSLVKIKEEKTSLLEKISISSTDNTNLVAVEVSKN